MFNPTVTVDGVRYWEDGEFVWLQRADNKQLINACEGASCLLEPALAIGIDQVGIDTGSVTMQTQV